MPPQPSGGQLAATTANDVTDFRLAAQAAFTSQSGTVGEAGQPATPVSWWTQPGGEEPGVTTDVAVTAFRLGTRAAFEAPADDASEAAEAVTTLVSWWNHLQCGTCGHTFRRGDRVRHDAQTSAVSHLDPTLGCAAADDALSQDAAFGNGLAGAGDATPAYPADLDEFAYGLAAAWPPAGSVPVTQLGQGDWRITPPRPPLGRARCLYCGHTFRENEYVIICPCSPASPACGAAVHRDPAAGLICWESWQPSGEVRLCPVTAGRPARRSRT